MSFNDFLYNIFIKIINQQDEEVISIIEDSNFDLDTHLNNFNWTALHAAVYKGNEKLVRYLLNQGAKSDLMNASGYSPKSLAERSGNINIIKLFDDICVASSAVLEAEAY